jgi:hypothetical protein
VQPPPISSVAAGMPTRQNKYRRILCLRCRNGLTSHTCVTDTSMNVPLNSHYSRAVGAVGARLELRRCGRLPSCRVTDDARRLAPGLLTMFIGPEFARPAGPTASLAVCS